MSDVDEWVPLFALPSREWGGCSVEKLRRVTEVLGVDPELTELSISIDDLSATWYVVMCPHDLVTLRVPHLVEAAVAEPELPAVAARGVLPPAPDPTPEQDPEPGLRTTSPICGLCGRPFATTTAAQMHEIHDHSKVTSAACPVCEYVFATHRGMKKHRTQIHGSDDTQDSDSRHRAHVPDEVAERVQRLLDPHLPDGPGPPAQWTPGEPMLGCGSCLWFGMEVSAMVAHTRSVHGRFATSTERTPLTDEERRIRLDAQTEAS